MQRFSRAYAKVNIGLLIHRRRPDGYHDLETVFHRIDLYDELSFEASAAITVSSTSDQAPSDESNLCHKAARLLQAETGCTSGVRIVITKRIPAGAGLGGGSSDAAAALLEIPRLWGLDLGRNRLEALAAQLGSDVPYFLRPGTALATGRGERLEYFSLDIPYAIVLCTPPDRVPTPWAYGQVRLRPERSLSPLREAVQAAMADPTLLPKVVTNDFEEAVFAAYPRVAAVKQALLEQGAVFALMSGSGSSVYGFFPGLREANEASTLLSQRGWLTAVTPARFHPPDEPPPHAIPGKP